MFNSGDADIAANDPATAFRNHSIDARAREHHGKQPGRSFGARKIARESVRRADRSKGF